MRKTPDIPPNDFSRDYQKAIPTLLGRHCIILSSRDKERLDRLKEAAYFFMGAALDEYVMEMNDHEGSFTVVAKIPNGDIKRRLEYVARRAWEVLDYSPHLAEVCNRNGYKEVDK